MGNRAPTSCQAAEQQVEPLVQRHLALEHIAELKAPVVDFDPPAFVSQPTSINSNTHATEVISQKDDEEANAKHRYNLRPRPNLFNKA